MLQPPFRWQVNDRSQRTSARTCTFNDHKIFIQKVNLDFTLLIFPNRFINFSKKTIFFLFSVATHADINWAMIYEFIFDRLRAIRQDIVIQRLDVSMSIELYEPIVKFHIYAGER